MSTKTKYPNTYLLPQISPYVKKTLSGLTLDWFINFNRAKAGILKTTSKIIQLEVANNIKGVTN